LDVILRLQCDEILGGRIDRETATGLVPVATVRRQGEDLVVHLTRTPESAGLERLDGLRARDCRSLQRHMGTPDLIVIMPDV